MIFIVVSLLPGHFLSYYPYSCVNMVGTARHGETKGCNGADKLKESSFTAPSEAEPAHSDEIYTTVMLS